jgi:predicted RNA binding protein YcfA (HicA-like mRNA interferase family)
LARSLSELESRPAHVTAKELLNVLEAHGWRLRKHTKHGTIAERQGRTVLVPRPHGNYLLPVYVRRVAKLLREAR